MPRTLRQILDIAKRDPIALTPGELSTLRRLNAQAARARADTPGEPTSTLWGDNSYVPRERALDSKRKRASRAAARDVEIPPVRDPARRESCRLDLLKFLLIYLAGWFRRPFAPAHLQMIADLQAAILQGESYVLIAPRGIGKSTIVKGAAVWAILYGHRRYVVILAKNGEQSLDILDAIRTAVETSDPIFADFPGPAACVRALEGNWNRANGQTHAGKRTFIKWGGGRILAFPTVPNEPSAGSCIATRSMKKAIHGLAYATPTGEILRPDFAMIDDPIEPEEATSERMVAKIIHRIDNSVMFLGESGTRISGVILATVMAHADVACHYSDPALAPGWRRRRFQFMAALPDRAAWKDYEDLRLRCRQELGDLTPCNDYYAANRAALDAGAVSNFPHCYDAKRGELSAVQYAMNIIADECWEVFQAQLQNIPPDPADKDLFLLSAHRVEHSTLPNLTRGLVPADAIALALGGDLGKFGLHWVLLSCAPGRIARICDYGIEEVNSPQGQTDENDRAAQMAIERAIRLAILSLANKFNAEPPRRPNGTPCAVQIACLDAHWREAAIIAACAEVGPHWLPVIGLGTAKDQPRWHAPRGVTAANLTRDGNLYLRQSGPSLIGHAHVDSYKQIVHTGFLLEPDEPGSLRLFDAPRHTHKTFAHHLTAERAIELSGRVVWQPVRGRQNNHYLDATAYAFAALSLLEHTLPSISVNGLGGPVHPAAQPRGYVPRPPTRITYAEIGAT